MADPLVVNVTALRRRVKGEIPVETRTVCWGRGGIFMLPPKAPRMSWADLTNIMNSSRIILKMCIRDRS